MTKILIVDDDRHIGELIEVYLKNEGYLITKASDDVKLEETETTIDIEIVNYGRQAIPPSDIPHIFDRFYRVEKSRSHFTGGSGLGLAITKSIIELHGGTIDVMSTPWRTAFTIKLFKKVVDL